MNLLLTGCFSYNESQLISLKDLGYNIKYLHQESDELDFDPSKIQVIVCNGLFLYHSLQHFDNLKLIQLTSAGFDRVPLGEIRNRGIKIFNARGVYSIPMAEWAMTKVLDIYKDTMSFVINHNQSLWIKNRDLREVYGTNVAIVGAGSVGSETAIRFKSFGASVTGFDLSPHSSEAFDSILHINTLAYRIQDYDIIIVTLPLSEDTRGMFNYKILSRLKFNAIIINLSRGPVFNENDLIKILRERTDIKAALDVFVTEPLPSTSPLWSLPNVQVSPHNSFISNGNSDRMFNVIYKNLKDHIQS